MSSAFCDLALAMGLTFGGLCEAVPEAKPPALPADDRSAWTIPEAPPRSLVAPPPMPPVIIERTVTVEKARPQTSAPEPSQGQAETTTPEPDAVAQALAASWQAAALQPPGWDALALQSPLSPKQDQTISLSLPDTPPMDPSASPSRGREEDRYESPASRSGGPVDNERILAADRYITGIVETGVNSQVGGNEEGSIVIQTARDVYGYHGRKVLVPKGSRLICTYAPPKDMGSSRLELRCARILMAGHRAEITNLGAPVGDVQGRQGVTGEVDRRFLERYGTAFLLTGLSTAVRFAAAAGSTDATDTTTAAAEKAAEELSNRFGEITASVLEESLSLVPVITIPQGTRVQIRPATDWYIAPPKTS